MPTIEELEAQLARLSEENARLKEPSRNKANGIVREAADQLLKAVREIATVEVRTLVGGPALAAALLPGELKDRGVSPAAMTPTADEIAQGLRGVQGGYTAIDMLQGDIKTVLSDGASSGDLKALHDEAVAKGTEILRQNIKLLAEVIDKLWDRSGS